MILNDITKKLEEIDPIVFYGAVNSSVKETEWNYIVFNRTVMKPSANKNGYADGYSVHIIREEFIPDGLAEEVIAKMREIDGMRESGNDAQYQYIVKPNTDDVVEMLSIDFVKVRKKA